MIQTRERWKPSLMWNRPVARQSARFVGLFVSGGFSAFFMLLLASQRLWWIPSETVVYVLSFIQWTTLGMTIAKVGADQVAFATESRNTTLRLDIAHLISRRTLPLAVIASLVIAIVFSPSAAPIALCAIVIDVYSLTAMAELNARQRFSEVMVANVLNYPVFFVLAILGSLVAPDPSTFLIAFLISSVTRCLWLLHRNKKGPNEQVRRFQGAAAVGLQQVMNFAVFRGDQLLLPLLGSLAILSASEQSQFVFLFRFPELISSGVLIMGLLLFPSLLNQVEWPDDRIALRPRPGQLMFLGAVCAGIAACFAVYLLLYSGDGGLDVPAALPYLVSAWLLLPANAIIYLFLGSGHLRSLLVAMSVALVGGGALVVAICASGAGSFLGFLVPLQLMVMLVGLSRITGLPQDLLTTSR